MPQPHPTLSRLAIASLLLITLAYFWNLGGAPPALSGDEVLFAIHGKSIATTGCDLNGRCWPLLVQIEADASSRRWYQPILFYAEAGMLSVLPMAPWVIRLPMVLVGMLDILLVYLVAIELGVRRSAALAAALVLAAAPSHFFFARQAADFLLPVPFVLAALWCLLRSRRTGQARWSAACGGILAVGTFSYVASWLIMPLLFVLSIVVLMGGAHRRRLVAALVAGAVAGVLPAALWLWRHPEAFASLMRHYAGVTDDSMLGGIGRWLHYYRLLDVASNFWMSLNPVHVFFIGSPDLLHGTRSGGLLLLGAAVFLLAGVVDLCVKRDHRALLLAAGAIIALAPAVLIGTPDAGQRQVTLVPFAALIAAIGVERVLVVMPRRALALIAVSLVIGVVQFSAFLGDYFGDYSRTSIGRYDPLNIRELGSILKGRDAAEPAPAIVLTMQDDGLGTGATAESYWSFYAQAAENTAIAGKTRFAYLEGLGAISLPPGSLIVTGRSIDSLERYGVIAERDRGVDDPRLDFWRVRSP